MGERGQVFVHSLDVAAWQRVSWSFNVQAGLADGLLGSSDVLFSVDAFWSSDVAGRAGASRTGAGADPDFHRQLLRRLDAFAGAADGILGPGTRSKSWQLSSGVVRCDILGTGPEALMAPEMV